MKNIYEIYEEIAKAKNDDDKAAILHYNTSYALKNVLKGMYDPNIHFVFDEIPEYRKGDSPPGMSYSSIHQEIQRAYLFEKNNTRVSPDLSIQRRKEILIQILEVLEEKEAKVFEDMIMKRKNNNLNEAIIRKAYPGLL